MVTAIKNKTKKEEIKKLLLSRSSNSKVLNSLKYSGKIRIKKPPVAIEKKLRDEWKPVK